MKAKPAGWGLAALAFCLCAGCGNGGFLNAPEYPQDYASEPFWSEAPQPGPEAVLRLTRKPGRMLLYEVELDRRQEGRNRFEEQDRFYLGYHCQRSVAQGEERFDITALRRTYIARRRREFFENGQEVERTPLNTTEFVFLGHEGELEGRQRAYAFTPQNHLALRVRGKEEELPLILLKDLPHFYFPVFPKESVMPGITWTDVRRAIIPMEQYPTGFKLRFFGRLREIREENGMVLGVVDYRYQGFFDSSQAPNRERFPDWFHRQHQLIHEFAGVGEALVDLRNDRLVERRDSFRVRMADRLMAPQPEGRPPQLQLDVTELVSRFKMKWLPPGTQINTETGVEIVPPAE
jgi:hypothetical protein